MSRFQITTPIRADPERHSGRLGEDGYLFFAGLVDPARIAAVRRDVTGALARSGWLAANVDPDRATPGAVTRLEAAPDYWEGYTAVQSLQGLHELGLDPGLVGAARSVLGADVLAHPRKVARANFPQRPEATTRAHQ